MIRRPLLKPKKRKGTMLAQRPSLWQKSSRKSAYCLLVLIRFREIVWAPMIHLLRSSEIGRTPLPTISSVQPSSRSLSSLNKSTKPRKSTRQRSSSSMPLSTSPSATSRSSSLGKTPTSNLERQWASASLSQRTLSALQV